MLVDLIRHGVTEMPGCLLGRTDAPLAQDGWMQFERQTDRILYDAIVTSPLQRTRVPAEALASARDVPLTIDEDWAELDFGEWDGRQLSNLRADESTAAALSSMYRSPDCAGPPDGESWPAFQARVSRAIDRLLALDPGGRVLVSTHAGPMRAALASACGMPFANLWAIRIDYGTRITLQLGRDAEAGVWGEIIEVVQP